MFFCSEFRKHPVHIMHFGSLATSKLALAGLLFDKKSLFQSYISFIVDFSKYIKIISIALIIEADISWVSPWNYILYILAEGAKIIQTRSFCMNFFKLLCTNYPDL